MQSSPCDNLFLNGGFHWFHRALGRKETMASNGLAVEEIMRLKEGPKRTLDMAPANHVTFIRSLPLFHRTGDIFFALAGTRPDVSLLQQAEDNLLWI